MNYLLDVVLGFFAPSLPKVLAAFNAVEAELEKLIAHHNEVEARKRAAAEALIAQADKTAATTAQASRVLGRVKDLTS